MPRERPNNVRAKKTGLRERQPVAVSRKRVAGAGVREADTRRIILEAALRTFSACGFSGGSISEIARLHGLSPALIHYHFQNKDSLWRAALDHGIGDVIRELTSTMEDMRELDPVSQLKFMMRRYIGIIAERPEVFGLIIRESEIPGPRLSWLAKTHLNPLYGLWTNLVTTAQSQGRIKAIVPPYHLSQIIAGAGYQFMASRMRMMEVYRVDVTDEEICKRHADAVIDILFTGLLTPAGKAQA